MEKVVLLSVYTDKLMNLSFLRILTDKKIENIKLPTTLDNYRLQHLLRPNFLLEIELIKTKKNWILKNIVSYKEIIRLSNYNDHTKFISAISLINKYVHEDQEVNILSFFLHFFANHPVSNLNIADFELILLQNLGFAPDITNSPHFSPIHWIKVNSGLA